MTHLLITGVTTEVCVQSIACNAGEHSTRHHATNRAWRAALAAVAVGEVILGDKEKAGEYKKSITRAMCLT